MSENNKVATRPSAPSGKPSALAVMASRLSIEPEKLMTTLKATVFKNANDSEIAALVLVSNEYGLNPFLKEIYAFPAKGGGIVPIVSVDGWNKMLLRQPDFDGIKFDMAEGENGPISCTATIFVKSRSHPVIITEYFDECYRKTEPWENMPRRMLRNRTLCQASRVAFGFSGIYNEDEAEPIIDVSVAPPKEVKPVAQTSESPSPTESKKSEPTLQYDELANRIVQAGHTFDDYAKYCVDEGFAPEVKDATGFNDLKADTVKRSIRAITGLLNGIAGMKAGAQ